MTRWITLVMLALAACDDQGATLAGAHVQDASALDASQAATPGDASSAAPSCTPGADQTCNDDPKLSSLHGHCEADGSCSCRDGFAKSASSGRCL